MSLGTEEPGHVREAKGNVWVGHVGQSDRKPDHGLQTRCPGERMVHMSLVLLGGSCYGVTLISVDLLRCVTGSQRARAVPCGTRNAAGGLTVHVAPRSTGEM